MAQAPRNLRGKARKEWQKANAGNTSSTTQADPATTMDPGERAMRALYGDTGYDAGMALGQKFYSDGSLGRVSESVPGQDEYLAQLKSGLGGYTSPEYQAQREQMMKSQNSNYLTAQAQLAKAQARGKVYGAAGAAQQANLATGNQASKDDLEQKLMVQNIDEQQRRLGAYGVANTAAQQAVLDRQKFNLGQQAAEKVGQVGGFTGAVGSAAINANQKTQNQIIQRALNSLGGSSSFTSKNKSKKSTQQTRR
jgi:hypothetical protein